MKFRTDKRRRTWTSEDGRYRIHRRVILGCLGMVYTCFRDKDEIGKAWELRGPDGAMALCREHLAMDEKELVEEFEAERPKRTRPVIAVEHEGVPMSLRELAERVGIAHSTITRRYREGLRLPELIAPPDSRRNRRGVMA